MKRKIGLGFLLLGALFGTAALSGRVAAEQYVRDLPPHEPTVEGAFGADPTNTGFNWGIAGRNQTSNFGVTQCPSGGVVTIASDGGVPYCGPSGVTNAAGVAVTPPPPLADYQVVFQNPYDGGTAIDSGVLGSLALTQYTSAIRWSTVWATTGAAFMETQYGIDAGGSYPSSLSTTTPWFVRYEFSVSPAVNGVYPETGVCTATGLTNGSTAYCTFFGGSNTSNNMGWAEWTFPPVRSSVVPLGGGWSTFLATSNGHQRLGILNDTGGVLHFQASTDGLGWVDTYSIVGSTSFNFYGPYATSGTGTTGYSTGFVYSNSLGIPSTCTVTGATNASPSVISITGCTAPPVGTQVAIHGSLGNTSINTSSGNYSYGGNTIVTASTLTSITTLLNGNGAWTSGGVVTITGL